MNLFTEILGFPEETQQSCGICCKKLSQMMKHRTTITNYALNNKSMEQKHPSLPKTKNSDPRPLQVK